MEISANALFNLGSRKPASIGALVLPTSATVVNEFPALFSLGRSKAVSKSHEIGEMVQLPAFGPVRPAKLSLQIEGKRVVGKEPEEGWEEVGIAFRPRRRISAARKLPSAGCFPRPAEQPGDYGRVDAGDIDQATCRDQRGQCGDPAMLRPRAQAVPAATCATVRSSSDWRLHEAADHSGVAASHPPGKLHRDNVQQASWTGISK